MRQLGGVDLRPYVEAFPLLVRTPALFLAPLLMAVIGVLIDLVAGPGMTLGGGGALGGITSGLFGFVRYLLDMFGLGVSLVIADYAWRRGRAGFEEGWNDARRRGGDILFAAIGLSFVLYVALAFGQFLGALALVLVAIAGFFFIYTIPAAAIGGVPGGAALQASVERARSAPLPTVVLLIVSVVLYFYVGNLLLLPLVWPDGAGVLPSLVQALIRAVVEGYLALILARVYNDNTYVRRY